MKRWCRSQYSISTNFPKIIQATGETFCTFEFAVGLELQELLLLFVDSRGPPGSPALLYDRLRLLVVHPLEH